MYENYQNLHPINVNRLDPKLEMSFNTDQYSCYVPGGSVYCAGVFPYLLPIWYTDWRDETLSWHLTCSFHAHLNPSPITVIRGPEAKKFLAENFVNNIEKFPVGISKHGIMCLDNGLIATHGVLLRTDEYEYEAWWHAPFIDYAFSLKKYDAELVDLTHKRFVFQLQGPYVLQILEEVTGDDLHDIDYRHFRDSSIDGNTVRILRFGMSGTLGYEIHGDIEYAKELWKKIITIGNPYGIRPLGGLAYGLDHTAGGFPQIGNSFISAMTTDPGFIKFSTPEKTGGSVSYDESAMVMELTGSAGTDLARHLFNPFEVGLGHCINWNHEFRGKSALQEYAKNRKRGIVTLLWNPEDLAEVYISQFRPGEECYKQMDSPGWETALSAHFTQNIDLILNKDGKEIGLSIGRTQNFYFRAMLSMGSIDREYQELDTEVYILWGEPGAKQMKIRAKVAPFPYNQHILNTNFDVNTIPKHEKRGNL